MDLSALEEVGLTSGEVKVYLALLKFGSTKTGALALRAEVSSSKVYKILDRLEQKGLVGHVIKEGVKNYKALETKKILDYIEDKEKVLKQKKEVIKGLVPLLEGNRGVASVPEATVYSGFKAVTSFFDNILEELGPGESYKVVGVRYYENVERMKKFFHKFHAHRATKKIKLKMLANHEWRGDIVKTTYKYSEIRFLPRSFPAQMTVLFYKNKSFLIVWSGEIFGFLIESQQVADSFEVYFENFWKLAEK